MKLRHLLFTAATGVAAMQLVDVARADAFMCKAEITTRSGTSREVSAWMHAGTVDQANTAWTSRLQGEHHPRSIQLQYCTAIYGKRRH